MILIIAALCFMIALSIVAAKQLDDHIKNSGQGY